MRVTGQQGNYSLITASERDQKAFRIERYEEARVAYTKEQERLKEERKNEMTGLYSEPDDVLRSRIFPRDNVIFLK